MKIAESAVLFNSERALVENHQKKETLIVWKAGEERRPAVAINNGQGQEIDLQKHISSLNKSTQVNISAQALKSQPVNAVTKPLSEESEVMVDLNIRILRAMVERFTGKRIRLSPQGYLQGNNKHPSPEYDLAHDGNASARVEPPSQGGLIYESYESYYEKESTEFSAKGIILSEDGEEIQFTVDLNMSREFFSEERVTIRAGDALKDPLVINFSGKAAELTDTQFSFDIDNDGTANQISFLKPGSGFLALDGNEDGRINNGSELFGPESGNGFRDLAAYDGDGNNWIDENDNIYNKLRVWTKDSDGNDTLFALGEKGIGAIYLGAASTLFAVTDARNALLGEVQSTGIFVRDNGGVGTVQQINLVA